MNKVYRRPGEGARVVWRRSVATARARLSALCTILARRKNTAMSSDFPIAVAVEVFVNNADEWGCCEAPLEIRLRNRGGKSVRWALHSSPSSGRQEVQGRLKRAGPGYLTLRTMARTSCRVAVLRQPCPSCCGALRLLQCRYSCHPGRQWL
jgi:hypothetical protein